MTIEIDRPTSRVARIRIARPERLNALSPALLRDLVSACETLVSDAEMGVVTLEGAGDSFSAGADLPAFATEIESAPNATADLGRVAAEALAQLPQITVAVIRGHCVGGGVVLAASCDVRICTDDARFWIPEVAAGIPLGWGGMGRLVALVGESHAVDWVTTCRPFDAAEALAAGLVSRVIRSDDLDAHVRSLLDELASRARYPLQVTKRQLQAIRAGAFDPTADAAGLVGAFSDPEAGRTLQAYLDRLR